MKVKKPLLVAALIAVMVAAAVILPAVATGAPSKQDQPEPKKPVISVSCTGGSSNPTVPAILIQKLESGDLLGHVLGCVEQGAMAGFRWVNAEHPGGGPGLWCLSFSTDPLGRGEVAEFWVWVRVLRPPLSSPAGLDLPPEFPMMVRLIDGGGSPEAADWEQLFLAGAVPLLDPEPGYEECCIPAGGVQIDRSSG